MAPVEALELEPSGALEAFDGRRWRPIVSVAYRPVQFVGVPGLTQRALVMTLGGPGPDYRYVFPMGHLPAIRWEAP